MNIDFFACTKIYFKKSEVELKGLMCGQDILLSLYNCLLLKKIDEEI